MDEALAFLHRLEEACADRIVPFEYGRGFFRDDRPNVWDLNFLRVERGGPRAGELVEAANELMVHLDHRRVVVDDEELAARLEPEFPTHAWTVERHLVMEHRRPPEAGRRSTAAAEALPEELEPLWTELDHRRGFVLGMRPVMEEAVPTRYFAAYASRAPACSCALYSRGGVGQVEDVVTLEEHRGQGLASAAVLAALDASLAEGNTLTFLVADADDWPYRLYERLGFETTCRRWRFQRLPSA
ncbi:MAG TPA: GNAT family N-acetyltransferase [Gaiellaceae bacterium]|nr:GNAT family N-acetyltransferase [Gaiellaceae bacterium]